MVLAMGVGACGRRGALEPPPAADDAPPAKSQKGKPQEKKSFLLDFLIQ